MSIALIALACVAWVCLLTAVFVQLARWGARRMLDEHDGSSI